MVLLSTLLGTSYEGAQGIQGIQGVQGTQGQGTQGVQGQGIQGLQGTDGLFAGQGVQGIAGESPSVVDTDRTYISFTATAGQTTFNTPYVAGFIDVFLNGIRLSNSEYTATDGSSIILNIGASEEDVLDIISYDLGNALRGGQGVQGIKGNQGLQGIQGLQGTDGLFAGQGIQGTQGVQGVQGPQGLDGAFAGQGIQGIQGFSPELVDTDRTYISFTATAGQTTFNTPYVAGFIDVFLNGIRLSNSEYTATNGSSIILDIGASQGDVLDIISYDFGNSLRGGQGLQGIQGTQGLQGIQGLQGTDGLFAGQGIQGTQGLQGVQGVTGFGLTERTLAILAYLSTI